ncbi:MAG: hypothetical protein P4L84_34375, partial [Isosphaeraceae bacterium]|nr:hypothetical protein [Isosphaeraceae bacterium]
RRMPTKTWAWHPDAPLRLRDNRWRSARSVENIAVFALVVDAKDEQAEAFCRHNGFVSFGSQPGQLVLPLTGFVMNL